MTSEWFQELRQLETHLIHRQGYHTQGYHRQGYHRQGYHRQGYHTQEKIKLFNMVVLERPLTAESVVGSIPPGGSNELFLVPACAPQLVYQRPWCVLSCVRNVTWKEYLMKWRKLVSSRVVFAICPTPYNRK